MCKDKNLKLVLVDEAASLGEKHSIGWDKDFDEFCRLNFGKTIELGYEINSEIEQFLLSLDIPQPDLLQLEYLYLDADHAVYGYMTDDVLAHLDRWMIHSLEGIESCENLIRVDLNSMTQKVDLQPLTRLPKLDKLVLDSYTATNYEALLSIPKLKKLEIYNWVLFTAEDKRALALVLQHLEPRCELAVSASWKNSIF